MIEGKVVLIVGSSNKLVREKQKEGPVYGTYVGPATENRVTILLGSGHIVTLPAHEVVYEQG
jgi:anaerobic C4-dicarboxylate transporter